MTDTAIADTAAAAAASAAAASAAKPWYDGKADAETVGHWQNKGWKIDDPAAVAIEATKAHRAAQALVGVPETQIIRLPKDATDEAAWSAVYGRLGVPADAKDYDLSAIKHADGTALDDAFAGVLRSAAIKARVPKDRAGELTAAVVKHLDAVKTEETAARQAIVDAERIALQKNWGKDYEYHKTIANRALTAVAKAAGLTEADAAAALGALERSGVGAAKVLEMFRVIGSKIGEDKFVSGNQPTGGPITREQASARKAELMAEVKADPTRLARYNQGGGADYREMMSLNQTIVGEAA